MHIATTSQKMSGGLRYAAILSAIVFGVSQFATSVPARAGNFDGSGDGGGRTDDYGADHAGIYQAQRGDIVCNSRAACGGPLAIPMNQPGYWYAPRGVYLAQQGYVPQAAYPAPRRHHKHRWR